VAGWRWQRAHGVITKLASRQNEVVRMYCFLAFCLSMFVFLQVEHAVEAPVEADDNDGTLRALDDDDSGIDEDDEDDGVDEDDNGNASVIFFVVLNA